MSRVEQQCVRLQAQRESMLRKVGQLEDNVLFRPAPGMIKTEDGSCELIYWPSMAIGKLRIVYRPESVVVVTDGLSDPWDPELHGENVPDGTFDLEIALEIPMEGDPRDWGVVVAKSWIPQVLWAASDYVLLSRLDIVGLLAKFNLCSLPIPPVGELEEYICAHGFMCGLVGIPFATDSLGQSVTMARNDAGDPISFLPIKLLTPDEHEFITQTNDATNAEVLVRAFLKRKDRHLVWKGRESAMPMCTPQG